MRRTPFMLAATAALVPVLITAGAVPAQAASYSITLTTLGRDGSKVATEGAAVNVSSGESYNLPSGKVVSVPKGTYAVMVNVWNTKDNTDTIGAKVVSVTGATTTTIDARKGQPFKVSLDTAPADGYSQTYEARVCMGDTEFGNIGGYNAAGNFYVIPNSSTTLRFAYASSWVPYDGSPDAYAVSGMTTGVPGALNAVFKRASLATVNVEARAGVEGSNDADLSVVAQDPNSSVGCQNDLGREITRDFTPFHVTAHVSPGKWDVRSDTYFTDDQGESDDIGSWTSTKTLSAGQVYSPVFYQSSWGPVHNLPVVLSKNLVFEANDMFSDPTISGFEGSEKATATLSLSGKVLSTQNLTPWGGDNDTFTKALASSGWYTLTISAARYNPDVTYSPNLLSPKSSLGFHFYVDPSKSQVTPGFITRFEPRALDADNLAQPRSMTTVGLHLDRSSQGPDAAYTSDTVARIQAWASFDNGATWQPAHVRHYGSTWTATVLNPESGAVSLRSTVVDVGGNSTTTTVYRAYGIGQQAPRHTDH